MKVKITGTVKVLGQWREDGAEVVVTDELGNELISKRCAVEVEKSQAEIDAEEQLKAEDAAKKYIEKQLKALRKKATELGIVGAADKDAETLTAEIEAADKK
jgi:hypothetical protein